MKDRLNRDEMFYRIAHHKLGMEKKEDILNDLYKISNPNFQDLQGTSYLHVACQSHFVEAISILLEMGSDPNINDKKGFSPILNALGSINEHNNDIFELMLQHGLDLGKKEGLGTLKDMILSFKDDEFNKLIDKYDHSQK